MKLVILNTIDSPKLVHTCNFESAIRYYLRRDARLLCAVTDREINEEFEATPAELAAGRRLCRKVMDKLTESTSYLQNQLNLSEFISPKALNLDLS